jgi:single-strand DNA-binding protein
MFFTNFLARLGADAEVKTSQNNNQFVSLRVAKNYYDGEKKTAWVNVTLFGERAIKMKEYLKKGSAIMLYGEITPTLGKNKAGESAIFFDMTADRFEFPNVGNSGGTQSDEATSDANFGKFKKNEEAAAAAPAPAGTTAADPADDLPF